MVKFFFVTLLAFFCNFALASDSYSEKNNSKTYFDEYKKLLKDDDFKNKLHEIDVNRSVSSADDLVDLIGLTEEEVELVGEVSKIYALSYVPEALVDQCSYSSKKNKIIFKKAEVNYNKFKKENLIFIDEELFDLVGMSGFKLLAPELIVEAYSLSFIHLSKITQKLRVPSFEKICSFLIDENIEKSFTGIGFLVKEKYKNVKENKSYNSLKSKLKLFRENRESDKN